MTFQLLTIHAVTLILSGHSAYAEVPLNFWIHDLFFLGRNHYARLDRFGQE